MSQINRNNIDIVMEVIKRKLTPKKLKRCINDHSKSKGPKEKKVEKISKPKKLERYVAVADYQAQENGELSLLPGLIVEVLEKSDTGWWFVNSEDDQGWVPCTYLEPEDGTEIQPAAKAELGQEEIFVCISDFAATNSDEISLVKGVAVSVLQKNMNGWFLIRYQGTEGYAPGTYLKKANNAQRMSVMEKSRLSGVEIIGSLQDVSTLLNQEKQEETKRDSSPMSQKKNQTVTPTVIVKQQSLERRGNFRPPPRQGSIKKIEVPSSLRPVRGIYVTISDFEANVEDGLTFRSGEKVLVKEKTPTGWWFVKTKQEEGWVPSTYLEPYCGEPDTNSVYELANLEDEDDEDIDDFDGGYSDDDAEEDDDDGNWYAQPDESVIVATFPSKHEEIQKRPLPKIPSQEQRYEKAEEVFSSNVRKPVSSRNLPPPPAPPVGMKKKEDTIKETSPPPKPLSASTENLEKLESVTSEPSDTLGGKSDLAAVLKAKFESRSVDSSSKTPLGDSENNKPAKPSKPAVPMMPAKPSDLKKSVPPKPDLPVTPSAKPAIQNQDRPSKFSKPPPPAKSKAILPTRQNHQENTTEKEISKHPLKPVKPVSPIPPKKWSSSESNLNTNKSSDALKPSASIADRSAAFSNSASVANKAAAFNKPGTPKADKAAAFNKSGAPPADKAAAFNKFGTSFNEPGTSIASKAAAFNKPGVPAADNASSLNKPGTSIADKAAAFNKPRTPAADKAPAFNKPGTSIAGRAAAFNKPAVSPQTKPKLLAKPEKPATPLKPSLTAKPHIPAKTNQKVSNIASSLNNKLNLQPSRAPVVDHNSNLEQENSVKSKASAIIPQQDKIVPNSQTTTDAPSEILYTALFDFVAENEGEITFNEGDELEMVEFGEDWSYVRVWEEEGWVPTSYLEKI